MTIGYFSHMLPAMMDFTGTPTISTFTVAPESAGGRLDKFLHEQLPSLTRNQVQVLIAAGQVKCGDSTLWHKNYTTKPGETYVISIPQPKPTHIMAVAIPLDIIYEDKHLLVINKPSGMTVHPGAGTKEDTLVHALVAHCGDSLSGIGGVARPGLIHRLDRDTTGLLVIAKNDRAHISLSDQLRNRDISRGYSAICWSVPDHARGTLETGIGRSVRNRQKMAIYTKSSTKAKLAITHYELLEKLADGGASLVRFKLETGRTHQIRVHATHLKFPIMGDKTYGNPLGKMLAKMTSEQREAAKAFPRQALHAQTLTFVHPVTGKTLSLKADFPKDFEALLETLRD